MEILKQNKLFWFLLAVVLQGCAICFSADALQNEAAWLHVDGRYIKDGNGKIFIPAGAAYIASDTVYGNPRDIIAWCKKHKINTVRLSMRLTVLDDYDKYMATYLEPVVEACKTYGVYVYFDMHGFFHEVKPTDTWLHTGPVFNDEDLQKWAGVWAKIAAKYKDEPWVLGYELMNEVYDMSGKQTSDYYIRGIKAIREVDKKHIIIVGTCYYTHASKLEETWARINFKPDEPYNQVLFSFHEYTQADDPVYVAPVLDKVMKRYNVPIMCTEFGSDPVVPTVTVDDRRKFEKDMFAMFARLQIGWSIWRLQGTYPDIKCNYEDIWLPALVEQASATSIEMKGDIELSVQANSITADNKSVLAITAVLKDFNGNALESADNAVSFSVSGGGATLEGENPAPAVKGAARINLKLNKTGKFSVIANAGGFYHSKLDITGKPDKAVKLTLAPSGISTGGKTKVEASITDAYGNIVDNGALYRVNCGGPEFIDMEGRLWLADQEYKEGSWGYTKPSRILYAKENYQFANTGDNTLFYTGRMIDSTCGYRFTVPNGRYKVELFFAETYFGVTYKPPESGKVKGFRVFDVIIENETRIKGLDIQEKAGVLAAYTETCLVDVKDGALEIFADNKVDSCNFRAVTVAPEVPSADKITFSGLEGINSVEPTGGKAVIGFSGSLPAKITASFPGLISGSIDIR